MQVKAYQIIKIPDFNRMLYFRNSTMLRMSGNILFQETVDGAGDSVFHHDLTCDSAFDRP